jgi:EmrB/QacA subfamily drug resistance transporter
VFVPVAAASFMTMFDGAAVQLALPTLRSDLQVPFDAVHWVMTAFLLSSSSSLLQAGRIGDVLGRERVWRAGVLLFAIASAAAAVMPGLWWLVAARAAQGLGAGLATANSAALLVDAFPDRRGKMLGLGNIAIALGLVAGPPIGAMLTRLVSWRLIFAVAVPVGLAAWLVAGRTLPRSERRAAPLAWSTGVLSFLGLGAVLVGGSFGQRWGWTSPATLVLLGAGLATIVAFFVVQARTAEPLLEHEHLTSRMFLSGLVSTFFGFAALFTVTISMPVFLLVVQGRPTIGTGLLVGVVPLGVSVIAPLAGVLTDRLGSRWVCTAALAMVGIALGLLVTGGADASTARIACALGLIGAGFGGFEAPNDVDLLGTLPSARLSAGTAVLNAVRNVGMTLGTALGGTLIAVGVQREAGRAGAEEGTKLALGAGLVCAVVGTIAAAIRPSRPVAPS